MFWALYVLTLLSFCLSVRLVLTVVSALSRVDLPEPDACLHARCCHDALVGVGLAVAGT